MGKSIHGRRKVAAIDQFGCIEKMKIQIVSILEILPDQILVRVESAFTRARNLGTLDSILSTC